MSKLPYNHNYHKKCTNLKSKSGIWKPSRWFCSGCTDELQVDVVPEKDKEVSTIEKPSSKHRKANFVTCDHADKEFLESKGWKKTETFNPGEELLKIEKIKNG